jgi:DNA-binding transcriptional regulator YhcF (GntR family)
MAYPHKSQKIADTIAGWFADQRYKPGDRFPSDQELAREFGVNHVTVRTALKRFVDAGYLERRVGAGTVVRDPRERKSTETGAAAGVALAIPDATHSFFSELLRAVEEALLPSGRPLFFGHTWELGKREEQVVGAWLAQGVRRMVLTPPVSEATFYQSLLDKGVRLVFVDRRVEGVDVPSIVSKDELGMQALVRHLTGLGFRRLCHLAGPASIWTARQRQSSFQRCSAEAGLTGEETEVLPAGLLHRGWLRGDVAPPAAGAAARGGAGGQRPGGRGGNPGAARARVAGAGGRAGDGLRRHRPGPQLRPDDCAAVSRSHGHRGHPAGAGDRTGHRGGLGGPHPGADRPDVGGRAGPSGAVPAQLTR